MSIAHLLWSAKLLNVFEYSCPKLIEPARIHKSRNSYRMFIETHCNNKHYILFYDTYRITLYVELDYFYSGKGFSNEMRRIGEGDRV